MQSALLQVQWLRALISSAIVSMPGLEKKSMWKRDTCRRSIWRRQNEKCPLMPHTVAKHWSHLACRNAIWWGRCTCVCAVCDVGPLSFRRALKWPAQRRRWGQWVSAYLPPQPRSLSGQSGDKPEWISIARHCLLYISAGRDPQIYSTLRSGA